MAQNVKGSTSAPTLPSRGSSIPDKEMKMNEKIDSTNAGVAPVLSRRNFLTIATAATLPAVVAADTMPKMHHLPQTLESQLDDCVAQLCSILGQMYPSVGEILTRHNRIGEGFFLSLTGHPTDCVDWTEAGFYKVRASENAPSGEYWVDRLWSDMDQRWILCGAFMFEGEKVGPREVLQPWQLACKLEQNCLGYVGVL